MTTSMEPSTPPLARMIYSGAGRLCGWLLCAMIVFSPWAFGTTQHWSILVMNIGGWTLGALFVLRRGVTAGTRSRRSNSWELSLGLVSLLLLGFCAASAWNASAAYLPQEWRLQDRAFLPWLPHSFDAPSSWRAFYGYLALAGAFWATHDWLKEGGEKWEVRGMSRKSTPSPLTPHTSPLFPRIPSRLRTLLMVLSVNGALLALEAIIQRTSGTNKLLWIMPTHDNKEALSQFGPFAYRSNGVQYLNLIWPMTIGFWWWLHQDRTQRMTRRGLHHILLPCVLAMGAASLFSLSRAGVGVAAGLLLIACVVFAARRGSSGVQRWGVVTFAIVTLVAGLFISWHTLVVRLQGTKDDPLAGRKETYALAGQMARDYPWFGTGPGTFGPLFQVYRQDPGQYWPAQLHNDWLELRITFGRIGFGLILAALALATLRWLVPGGAPRDSAFLVMTTLSLAGCLAHAAVDFPFQIYSLEFLFLIIAAVLFNSSRPCSPKGGMP